MRGFFEIGIYQSKTPANIGALWRSAYQLGATGIFVIGKRYQKQASDTLSAIKHIPLRQYETVEQFLENRPHDTQLIAVEMGGKPLSGFVHPERAQRAFIEDKKHIDWSEAVVVLHPCGKSSHLEAGYAKGSKKLLFMLGEFPKGEFDVMYGFADGLFRELGQLKQALQG